jgi:hypothetical protein
MARKLLLTAFAAALPAAAFAVHNTIRPRLNTNNKRHPMNKLTGSIVALALALAAPLAHADWHIGKILSLNIAYDGSTITFALAGHTRTNCTCYPTWPNTLCLNRSRLTFKEEVAFLYSARARDKEIAANIDEASCSVVALYETD